MALCTLQSLRATGSCSAASSDELLHGAILPTQCTEAGLGLTDRRTVHSDSQWQAELAGWLARAETGRPLTLRSQLYGRVRCRAVGTTDGSSRMTWVTRVMRHRRSRRPRGFYHAIHILIKMK